MKTLRQRLRECFKMKVQHLPHGDGREPQTETKVVSSMLALELKPQGRGMKRLPGR